jgi:hypothetical protein
MEAKVSLESASEIGVARLSITITITCRACGELVRIQVCPPVPMRDTGEWMEPQKIEARHRAGLEPRSGTVTGEDSAGLADLSVDPAARSMVACRRSPLSAIQRQITWSRRRTCAC